MWIHGSNQSRGLSLCDTCQTNNLFILNGRHGCDRNGSFTCYNHNQGNSSIDYVVVSPLLFEHVLLQVHEFGNVFDLVHIVPFLFLSNPIPQIVEHTRDEKNNTRD